MGNKEKPSELIALCSACNGFQLRGLEAALTIWTEKWVWLVEPCMYKLEPPWASWKQKTKAGTNHCAHSHSNFSGGGLLGVEFGGNN